MCGRTRCTLRVDDVPRAVHRTVAPSRTIDFDRFRPSYNVAPGWNMPVVRMDLEHGNEDPCYAVHIMKWGLIPSFTKKTDKPDFYKMFNARAESVGEKPSFRRLLPKNRCLVTVDGFYEWKREGSKKQPYYIHFNDGRPLVFAALYDSWKNSEDEMLYTFTIVTTFSSQALRWLHDRMPVILGDKEDCDLWLCDSSKFTSVLKSYENPDLVWYPVTPQIGKIPFDGPECVQEIKLKTEGKGSISKFFGRKQIKKEADFKQEEGWVDEKLYRVEDENEGTDIDEALINVDKDCKPVVQFPTTQKDNDNVSFKRKRDPDYVSFDEELKPDSNQPKPQTPKKLSSKTISDRQPTLLSYFGKK